MVGRWGMSDKLGPIALLPTDGQGGYLLPGAAETSPQTQWLIDEEVRRIVDDAHAEVTPLLTDHRDQLESLTQALLAAETLDAADAYAAAGVPMPAPPGSSRKVRRRCRHRCSRQRHRPVRMRRREIVTSDGRTTDEGRSMSELASAIQAEPADVQAMLSLDLGDAIERLEPVRHLWLVGTGTSQHAAELGAWMFAPGEREVGWRSSAAFAAEQLGDGLRQTDGVIVLSHTGETALARRARAVALAAGAQVVSVTAQGSDWPEAIQTVPRERSDTYTGSYLAALVVLARLSIGLDQSTLDERSLAELPDAIRGAIARPPGDIHLADARAVVFAGVGPGAITAREAALKLREAARVLAEGYEAEYLLHGSAVPLDGRDTLIAIQPARDRFGLLDGLLRAASAEGLSVGTLDEPDGLHPVLAQIPLTVQAQLLADRTAQLRGQNPDTVITGAWNDDTLWQAGAPSA